MANSTTPLRSWQWLIVLLHFSLPVCAQSSDANVSGFKADYLLRFAELTEWPKPLPMTLCLRGESALRGALVNLNGQSINGEPLSVIEDDQTPLEQCRILYIADSKRLSADLLEQIRVHHVLLVSDQAHFAERGGMLQFDVRNQRMHLTVNLSQIRKAGIRLSSKLLRMATVLQ